MEHVVKYGWYAILVAMIGDILVSFLLSFFYHGYSNTRMSISALGNLNSPVRLPFNVWMLLEGVLFLVGIPAVYDAYYPVSRKLTIVMIVFIISFAIGACIFTCFFSVNESKDMITTASVIHGVGSVIGFSLFLFVPLLLAILSFRGSNQLDGVISVIAFLLSFLFFALFIMSDKPEFSHTWVAKEGLWQRLNLLCMYMPLGYISFSNITNRFSITIR